MGERVKLLAVGDVGPYSSEEPEKLFSGSAEVLGSADLRFCHLDTPYSSRGTPSASRGMPRKGPPEALKALAAANFEVVDFASNHGLDWGSDAFLDTIDLLNAAGHLVIGAGRTLAEARRPAIVERNGTKVGFLAYNSIVMARLSGYIADVERAGVVPLRVYTHYEPAVEMFDYTPGMPARVITLAYHEDLAAMARDVEALRELVDVLVVSQHAGVPLMRAHTPMYQHEIAVAAIDAGADVVLQHHAHMLRGIGFYKGAPIFYGLGDFAYEAGLSTKGTVVQHKSREAAQLADLYSSVATQVGREGAFFGPDERHYSMVAVITIENRTVAQTGYLPALLNDRMQPRILAPDDPRGAEVNDYIESITTEIGLETRFDRSGDHVVVSPLD